MALHLFRLLSVDLDGVDSVLMSAGLVEVGTVTELLLFIEDLGAIRHHCGEEMVTALCCFYKVLQVKTA